MWGNRSSVEVFMPSPYDEITLADMGIYVCPI